jgi:drug/metabolite transporter (DMT)-like permease
MTNLKGHISVLTANLIYGLNYVIAKDIMPEYFSPLAIIFVRVLGTVLPFWILWFFFVREKVEKKDLLKIAFCALFGIGINQIMFFVGLNLTTPINSAIIMTVNPVFVLIFAAILIQERITFLKIAGIVCACAGAVLLILKGGGLSFESNTLLGNFLTLINAISFALYLVLIKPLTLKYHPLTIMFWVFFFGLLYILPVCSYDFFTTDFSRVPFSAWSSLAYIVIAATFLGYLLYNFALRALSPTTTSSYIYLQPLFTVIIALIMGKDSLGIYEITAAALIFSGVFLVSIYHKKLINPDRLPDRSS